MHDGPAASSASVTAETAISAGRSSGSIDALARVEDEREVEPACDELVDLVAEHADRAADVGRYVLRRAYGLLTSSALIADVLEGPRALQRDHRAVARILEDRPEGDGAFGVAVDRWALALPYCSSLRARRKTLAAAIRDVGAPGICNLETLPPVELADAGVAATVVSADRTGLREATGLGVTPIPVNVVQLARSAAAMRLPPQRLIYTSGLVEYLGERDLVRLLDSTDAHLEPGGAVVVGTAGAGARDASFWEHVLGWKLVRRTPSRLADAFARSEFGAAPVETIAAEERGGLLAIARRDA